MSQITKQKKQLYDRNCWNRVVGKAKTRITFEEVGDERTNMHKTE
jgi:hypothetical protein